MSNIILFGGSSEIGIKVAEKIFTDIPRFDHIKLVSTSLQDSEWTVKWDPQNADDVNNVLKKVVFEKDDIVVIAMGYLGEQELLKQPKFNLPEIEKIIRVNFEIPLFVLMGTSEALSKVGGGKIMVMTSSAAFPVLETNLVYGTAKRNLDDLALHLSRTLSKSKIDISVIRSGFVPTKLNHGRKPTPFAISADQVADIVSKQINAKIIWTPSIFRLISLSLTWIPLMSRLASKKVKDSWD
jgi:decaprenylphospho-beta-D-erythro-pentofuranosid-2-ulose 2-reductase